MAVFPHPAQVELATRVARIYARRYFLFTTNTRYDRRWLSPICACRVMAAQVEGVTRSSRLQDWFRTACSLFSLFSLSPLHSVQPAEDYVVGWEGRGGQTTGVTII